MSDIPTSPLTTAETPLPSSIGAPATLMDEWRRLGSFLKQPQLETKVAQSSAFKLITRIYLLDMLAMFALVIAASIAVAMGVYLPKTAIAGMEFTPTLILAVIIGAPLLEEVAFRSWLSGEPAHIAALLLLGMGMAAAGILHVVSPLAGAGAMTLGTALAVGALVIWRTRPAMDWFTRAFPLFFWFSALAFALIHIFNFDEGAWWMLLPLVLPQFVLGSLAGYVRVRVGLWGAILLHAMHNASALGIAALASLG